MSWIGLYRGLFYVSLLPDFMPVFSDYELLCLLLCLLVIDPDITTKINNESSLKPQYK